MNEPISDRDPVEVLAEEFRERLRRGERPDVEEYARRRPDLAEQIRDLFPALLLVEGLKGAAPPDLTAAGPLPPSPAATGLERLGDYRILREVGRGGMGVVYEAEQESLGRRVALKVLPAQALADARQRKRFQREAKAAARLHHSNIVPVYGVGEHDGTQYYVMQFIQGQGLDQVLTELQRLRRPQEAAPAEQTLTALRPAADVARSLVAGCPTAPSPASAPSQSHPQQPVSQGQTFVGMGGAGREYWQSVARLGAQVADALDYAAGQGVLHRDVKPSNILLDAQGNAWVADFGLAKAAADENLTHTAEVVGTLRYMAPERFDGRSDVRSDVYALGLTLYEMLTLRPGFDGTDAVALTRQVLTEDPVPPRAVDPSIPRDLETVVLKAMAREPGRRYQTAAELAADLRRYREDRPIRARRVGTAERLGRWCRRNPVVAALAAGVAVLLVGGAVASVAAAVHAGSLARQARQAREEAVEGQDQAEKDLAQAEIERAAAETARKSESDLRAKAEGDQADAEKSRQEAAGAARQAEAHSQKARAVVDDFVARVSDSQALRGPEMRRLRRDLLASALPFYQDFIARHAADAEARPALAAARLRAGDIQRGVGKPAEAREEYQAALALYRELVKGDPRSAEFQLGRARCQAGLGAHQEAVRDWEALLASDRGNGIYQAELARALAVRAAELAEENPKAEALAAYERAAALGTALVEADLDNADARTDLARTTFGLGRVLADAGRRPDAVRQVAEGVGHAEHAFARNPQALEYGRLLAAGYGQLAELQRGSDAAGAALPWYDKAVQLWQRLAEDNPTVATLHAGLHAGHLRLAACQRALGHDKEADGAVAAAGAVLDKLPRETPEERFNVACVLALVARDADPEEASQAADRALDALRQAVAAGFRDPARIQDEEDLDALRSRQDFRDLVAQAERAEKERLAARTPAVIEAERRKARLATRADLAAGQFAIGLALMGLDKNDAAAAPLAESLKLREALVTDDPANARRHRADVGLTHVALGQLDWKVGRWAEATRAWHKGLDLLESVAHAGPRDAHLSARLADAERTAGSGYWEIGLWDEATDLYVKSFVQRTPTTPYDWHYPAYLLLYRGDLAGYRQHCLRMLRRFPRSNERESEWAVRACTAGPAALADLSGVLHWAEQGKASLPTNPFRLLNLARAYFRVGRFKEAVEALQEGSFDPRFAAPYFALIYDGAGRRDEAREWLALADRWHEKTWQDALAGADVKPPTPLHMHDLVGYEAARREAHERIDGKAPPDDPWRRLHTARAYFKLGLADKAEAALAAAVAARPDDPAVLLARGRVLARAGLKDRAEADFATAGKMKSTEALTEIRQGRFLAEGGRREQADAAFARAEALTGGELNRFLEAGWWVAGPYPEDVTTVYPPEVVADPSRPAGAYGNAIDFPWATVPTGAGGRVDFRPSINAAHVAAYALAHVWSPGERTATVFLGGSGPTRLWVNGRLVYETAGPHPREADAERVPVVLRGGRNTLLVKVGNAGGDHFFQLRFADRPLDQALRHADVGLWDDAAAALRRWFDRVGPMEAQDPELWRASPLLLLAAGDAEGCRRQCSRLFERFGTTTDPNLSWPLAYDLALAPGAVADTSRLARLAEEGMKPNRKERSRQLVLLLARHRAGEHNSALKVCDEFPELKEHPPAWLVLAMTHHRLGHKDEARQWLKKADEWHEKETRAILDGTGFRLPPGSWWDGAMFQVLRREARTLIDAVPPKGDPGEKALQGRGRDFLKGDPLTADFDRAIHVQPDEPRLWLAHGRRLAELKRDAGADLAKAVALRPKDAPAWKERGRLYAELGQPDKAAADFVKALELATDRVPVIDELARWDEVFERVARGRPGDRQLWERRVEHFAARGRWPEAARAISRVVEIDPADAWQWFSAAPLLLESGDVEGYRKVCREMLARFGQANEDTLAERTAKTCLLLPGAVGDAKQVQQLAARAVAAGEKSPHYQWFRLTKALADYRAGQYAASLAALKDFPPDPLVPSRDATAYVVTALAHQRLAQGDEARQALRRARAVVDQKMPKCERGQMFDRDWANWLRCRILLREAEALIEGRTEKQKAE